MVSYTDTVMGAWTYSYDKLNRLAGAAALASGAAGISNSYVSAQSSWNYDR